MEERQYQKDFIENIIEKVSVRRKVLAQLPTGGGKTVCFALIAQRYIRKTGKSVMILVHRQELMYQAQRTIKELIDIDAYLITSSTRRYSINRVYIGMVESTLSRMNMFDNVGLVIVDECHIANFNKIHNIFLEELIIGFSATPLSSSKKEPLNKYYQSIVAGPQIKTLIEGDYLSQNITRCPKDIVDATQFEINKLKGDYDERQMATQYKLPKHIQNVVNNYFKYCLGKKTIIFNVNIEHSKEVTKCFQFFGYNCKHLDSNSTDREEVLQWFKETEDAILCNVMIATVGFDEPTIRNVILNFATLSVVKFIQCCGRGSRALEDKHFFNIIDMGGNCIRFGDWCDDRDWEYIFNHPPQVTDGIAPVKTCPECEGLVHAAVRVCTLHNAEGELCLHEFEKKPTAEEQDMEEMILITKGINIEELTERHKNKYPYYGFFELGHTVVSSIFEEYNEPSEKTLRLGFIRYYNLCIEWYNKNLSGKDGNLADITNSAWHIKRAINNYDGLVQKFKSENRSQHKIGTITSQAV